MAKEKKGLLAEFKTFITRGNVIDLAVGMIIGAAFTAIVTALVNGIFKPLIDAIPIGNMEGLITMLVPKNAAGVTITDAMQGEAAVIDLSKSVYINWGDFIMAIINFLLTAIVLFLIVKLINTIRENAKEMSDTYGLSKEEYNELKKSGMSREQIKAYAEKKAKEEADKKAAEAPETADKLLKDIRDILRVTNPGVLEQLQKEQQSDQQQQ